MFGLGMGELIVIAVVALLVLGPDKLPDAARTLSKGIRDFRKHSKDLTQSLDDDDEIGGAIRDIKSALRGDELKQYIPPHILDPNAPDPADDDAYNPADEDAVDIDGGDRDADEPFHPPEDDPATEAPAELSAPTEEPMIRPAKESVSRTPRVRAKPTPPSGAGSGDADESHG